MEACNIGVQSLQPIKYHDLLYNIRKKYLQHIHETFETLEIRVFHHSSFGRCRAKRGTVGSGQPTTEDGCVT
jgi:hypothetical protein